MLSRPRHARVHAAKAKACNNQGQGMLVSMLPRPRHVCVHAAKAKACPRACYQGHGSPHGQAVKAKAHSQGHGMLAWAHWHAVRRR
nr:hypothetical protein CFP56_49069 [Quercus suber]